jgi:glycosyltransferase involved in cell wall biosynthesis
MKHMSRIKKTLLPVGSKRHQSARNLLEALRALRSNSHTYEQWIRHIESKQKTIIPKTGPLISIICPAYNTPDRYLDPLVDSVIGQTYAHWQLVLVNGSPDQERSAAISKAAKKDKRIKEVVLKSNEGIAATTNDGLKEASGEYAAFMDHDDTLAPFALAEVASALSKDSSIDLFYSDEDKLADDGSYRLDPLFKPDWSPNLFLAANYLAHFVVVRKTIADKVNGIRLGYDGAQDFDFLLRVLDLQPKIHHVPRVSYHWRLAAGSTAKAADQKSYADDAGQRALRDFVERNDLPASVQSNPDQPTYYRLAYRAPADLTVRIIGEASPSVLDSITAAGYKVASGESDVTLFVDSSIKVPSDEWVKELASVATLDGKGLVGALVLDQYGHVADAGYFVQNGKLEAVFRGLAPASWTHTGLPLWPRDLVVPPLSCCMVQSSLIADLEGEDPVVIALSLHRRGLQNLLWSYSQVKSTHLEEDVVTANVKVDPFLNSNLKVKANEILL